MIMQQVAKRDAASHLHPTIRKAPGGNRNAEKAHSQLFQDRSTYEEYRKAGYSKKFLEAHREEITLHKAAKAAFDELGVKKLLKVKELSIEYARGPDRQKAGLRRVPSGKK